jgi:hypothetical protein
MIFYTLLIYITIIITLMIIKPKMLFHNNKIKQFGFGKNKSIYSFHVINILIVIIIHFFISYFSCLFNIQ